MIGWLTWKGVFDPFSAKIEGAMTSSSAKVAKRSFSSTLIFCPKCRSTAKRKSISPPSSSTAKYTRWLRLVRWIFRWLLINRKTWSKGRQKDIYFFKKSLNKWSLVKKTNVALKKYHNEDKMQCNKKNWYRIFSTFDIKDLISASNKSYQQNTSIKPH